MNRLLRFVFGVLGGLALVLSLLVFHECCLLQQHDANVCYKCERPFGPHDLIITPLEGPEKGQHWCEHCYYSLGHEVPPTAVRQEIGNRIISAVRGPSPPSRFHPEP